MVLFQGLVKVATVLLAVEGAGVGEEAVVLVVPGRGLPLQMGVVRQRRENVDYVGKKVRPFSCRPRWLSWMRCPTGDQEVAVSTPSEVGNILSWRLIMKYFLQSFSPFH